MDNRLVVVGLLAILSAACGGGGTAAPAQSAPPLSSAPPLQTAAAASGAPSDIPAASSGTTSGKDACAALPRATIQQVVGVDPGEGELERAASSTICRYYGKAQVTVEIDPGSDIAGARVSIEAYGDTCEPIGDIGEEALFCTGGFKAQGFTGQIVWTDGQRTYFVVYNFGDAKPSLDVPLALARRLEA